MLGWKPAGQPTFHPIDEDLSLGTPTERSAPPDVANLPEHSNRLGSQAFNSSLELAASGENVAAAGLADEGGDSLPHQRLMKLFHGLRSWSCVLGIGPGIPCDQIHLGGKAGAAYEACYFEGIFKAIGDSSEQNIFECDSLARAQRYLANSLDDLLNRPLAIDGHYLGTDAIVRRVETDGESGAEIGRFFCELFDARNDAGGGNGHTLRAKADFTDEKANCGHEVVVVEEGLAHAHEDQVDAIAADADLMAVEDGDDLAGNFTASEIALETEFGGETELAIDGTTDLAGDADGRATPFFGIGFSVVTGFSIIPFRHPHGFRRFTFWSKTWKLNQITFSSIDGSESLRDDGTSDLPPFFSEPPAKRGR